MAWQGCQLEGMLNVVCGVILDGASDESGRFLACQRPQGKHLGGLWEFPGGKVEDGEEPAQALARELREELGVGVAVGEALEPVAWTDGNVSIRLLPYLCRITEGEPKALEHERLAWCATGDFDRLPWAPADVPVLEQLRAREPQKLQ